MKSSVRGTGSYICLMLSTILLVGAVWLIFGDKVATAILAIAGAGYGILAVARGSREEGANILQRLFALSGLTYVVSGLFVIAGLCVLAWPQVRNLLWADLQIEVRNERNEPVRKAAVTITSGVHKIRVPVNDLGEAHFTYAKRWGPNSIVLEAAAGPYRTRLDLARLQGGPFADQIIGVWSGEPLLRAMYATAEGGAIASIVSGSSPDFVAFKFPNVVGVVRNDVLAETQEFLEAWSTQGAQADEYKLTAIDGQSRILGATGRKWPRAAMILADLPPDANRIRRLLNLTADNQLPSRVFVAENDARVRRVLLEGGEPGNDQDALTDEASTADSTNRFRFGVDKMIVGLLNGQDLIRFANSDVRPESDDYFADADAELLLKFFSNRNPPTGMLFYISNRIEPGLCEIPDGAWATNLLLQTPEPHLRIMVIQNVSHQAVSIDSLRLGLVEIPGIHPISDFDRIQKSRPRSSAFSEGTLQPGEALIVPTRFWFTSTYPEISNNTPDGYSAPQKFSYTGYVDQDGKSLFDREERISKNEPKKVFRFSMFAPTSQRIRTIDDFRWVKHDFLDRVDVRSVSVVMNGIEIPLRPDRHVALMVSGSQEWGGRCGAAVAPGYVE